MILKNKRKSIVVMFFNITCDSLVFSDIVIRKKSVIIKKTKNDNDLYHNTIVIKNTIVFKN